MYNTPSKKHNKTSSPRSKASSGLVKTPSKSKTKFRPWTLARTTSTPERPRTTVQELNIAPPELQTLKASTIATFLDDEKAYRIAMRAAGRVPLHLFSLIKPELLSLMKTFVRMELGATEAKKLPDWESLGDDKPGDETADETAGADDGNESGDPENEDALPVTPDIITWSSLVRTAMSHAAQSATADGTPTTTYAQIAEVVAAEVRWPIKELSCRDALNQLLETLNSVERRLGCRKTLRGAEETDKRFIKLLTDAVRPAKFKELISDQVAKRKKVSFDEWIDIVLSLTDFYTGMQLQYKSSELWKAPGKTTTASAKRAAAGPAKDHGNEPERESPSKKQKRPDGEARHKRAVPDYKPSKPCRQCGGDCWSFACKNWEKVKEKRMLRAQAKAAKLDAKLDNLRAQVSKNDAAAASGIDGTL